MIAKRGFLIYPIYPAIFGHLNPFSTAEENNCSANSVDPSETAHHEPSHQDLHCLPFCFDFGLRHLFGTMVLARFKDGRVHDRN